MYVKQIVIRNFRSIAHADMIFKPGLNLIVGRNGSGKSAVVAAARLLLDSTLGKNARSLESEDFHGNISYSGPGNIVIAARLDDFRETIYEQNLRTKLSDEDGIASKWIMFRFRPKLSIRNQLANGTIAKTDLTRTHYEAERLVGVREQPADLNWDSDTPNAQKLTDEDVDELFVTEIPALRDVVEELRRKRTSPLVRLIENIPLTTDQKSTIETAFATAQHVVEDIPELRDLSETIKKRYEVLSQEGLISLRLGLSQPGYLEILRDMGLLLTDDLASNIELHRNGLGLNNLLFIAMLLQEFRARITEKNGTPILLVEEPEAHLHPQAQQALTLALLDQPFQTIATTHSAIVSSLVGLSRIINFDRSDYIKGRSLEESSELSTQDLKDLNRFLSSDRGNILFAKTIILVEGPADEILIKAYATAQGIKLATKGIHVASINGTHFSAFEKLLGANGLNRKYIVVHDMDRHNGKSKEKLEILDDGRNASAAPNHFGTATTLEYAITRADSIAYLAETSDILGMPDRAQEMRLAIGQPMTGAIQKRVLLAAVAAGKARFAQIFADFIERETLSAPAYIQEAIEHVSGASLAFTPLQDMTNDGT